MIVHTNRRGKAFYLHERRTASGKKKYVFSFVKEGPFVESIPEGYEVYENPNGQVFLRLIIPQLVTDEELRLVQNGVRRHAGIDYAIVEARSNLLIVLLPGQDLDYLASIMKPEKGVLGPKAREALVRNLSYNPRLRFVMTDADKRLFEVQRMSYLGTGGWSTIASAAPLATQVRKFSHHLGDKSFFEQI